MIELDPEIAAAFGDSANISSKYFFVFDTSQHLYWYFIILLATKGRGVHILKAGSKRRRT